MSIGQGVTKGQRSHPTPEATPSGLRSTRLPVFRRLLVEAPPRNRGSSSRPDQTTTERDDARQRQRARTTPFGRRASAAKIKNDSLKNDHSLVKQLGIYNLSSRCHQNDTFAKDIIKNFIYKHKKSLYSFIISNVYLYIKQNQHQKKKSSKGSLTHSSHPIMCCHGDGGRVGSVDDRVEGFRSDVS